MGSMYIVDVLRVARSYIGYEEGPNNWNVFAQRLDECDYFAPQKKQNVAWCGTFVDDCFLEAAIPEDRDDEAKKYDAQFFLFQPSYNNYSASASCFASYFKNAGEWYTSDPRAGDIIFFQNDNGIYHVGIVESVDGDTINTIEGNTSDKVLRRSYDRDAGKIAGYGRPRYDGYDYPSSSGDETTTKSIKATVTYKNGIPTHIDIDL